MSSASRDAGSIPHERWHRSANIGVGARAPVGTAVTGASSLLSFILVLTGAYLWWPRRWTGHALRSVLH